MNILFRTLTVLCITAFAQTAQAQFFDNLFQEAPRKAPVVRSAPQPKPAAPVPDLADPPYQSRLERLSEILGALHYLGLLCYPEEKNVWREHMNALIEAENPTQARRDRMSGAFNRSYGGFKENYRTCNASAKLAGQRYSNERIRLSRELISRFTD